MTVEETKDGGTEPCEQSLAFVLKASGVFESKDPQTRTEPKGFQFEVVS
ncbi:hypothetical protein F444_01977 [Phytophthora nicotianae P1976]|uniref:Uncharacterized protein n=1 Tax=Phytophthora nicotianae P1976 TaxID=1317066 RepID=A0A081AYX5_PHYNI|nr:hypothetical protein F444_01977 [Phytophthora nicotianae P1976]